MAGRPQLVGEGQEAVGLTLRVVKQQYLGHGSALYPAPHQEEGLPSAELHGLGLSLSESRGVLF